MSFVSISFYILVILLLIAYYALPHRYQWTTLLVGSLLFFCMAGNPLTIVYLIAAASVTWHASNRIRDEVDTAPRGKKSKKARRWLAVALIVDLGILAALKYANFLLLNCGNIYNLFAKEKVTWSMDWAAALGVSFYTLQIVGYLLDAYWNRCEAQGSFFKFLLFSCFFTQMVSGPISQYNQLGPELFAEHDFDGTRLRRGAWRVFFGILKKVVLAENLAIIVPYFFSNKNGPIGPLAFFGMMAYVLQIYADFSGCMDIALGTAECFGIRMVENFNAPFLSRSIQEFWQRWHITLGIWLRNYVMYPLLHSALWVRLGKRLKTRGRRKAAKKVPMWLAMLVLWLCMGLWHGGGWNYIMEGIWFWAVIVVGDLLSPVFKVLTRRWSSDNKAWIMFQRVRTTLIYSIGATFFCFPTIKEGAEMLMNVFSPAWIGNLAGVKAALVDYVNFYGRASAAGHILNALIAFSLFLVSAKAGGTENGLCDRVVSLSLWQRVLLFGSLVYLLLIMGVYGAGFNETAFIYGGF